MTGKSRASKWLRISGLVWYLAPSRRISVSCCQPGNSRSSLVIRLLKKVSKTLESVLAYVSASQTFPSVSMAAMMEILGLTVIVGVEQT